MPHTNTHRQTLTHAHIQTHTHKNSYNPNMISIEMLTEVHDLIANTEDTGFSRVRNAGTICHITGVHIHTP